MKRPIAQRKRPPEIALEITPDGCVRGLWNDALGLGQMGHCTVERVSYVEFSIRRQRWCVREAQPHGWFRRLLQRLFGCPSGHVLYEAPSREQSLHWEARHFAPGGPGWKRLRKRRRASRMS
jgi:hypothetical protein